MAQAGAAAGPRGADNSTRCAQWCSEIPILSRLILIVCVALYVDTWVDEYALYNNSIGLKNVVVYGQYYRILTAAWFHNGALHLAMNMVAAFGLCNSLEKLLGSIPLCGIVVSFGVINSLIYLLVFALYFSFTGSYGQDSVGFSGILFSFVMIEAQLAGASPRSVFGFCSVPAWVYPWVLLGVLQLLMPGISFVGHLAGILTGYLYAKGILNWCSLPRRWIVRFEHWTDQTPLSCITRNSMWYRCPESPPLAHIQLPQCQQSHGPVVDDCELCGCCDSVRNAVAGAGNAAEQQRFVGGGGALGGRARPDADGADVPVRDAPAIPLAGGGPRAGPRSPSAGGRRAPSSAAGGGGTTGSSGNLMIGPAAGGAAGRATPSAPERDSPRSVSRVGRNGGDAAGAPDDDEGDSARRSGGYASVSVVEPRMDYGHAGGGSSAVTHSSGSAHASAGGGGAVAINIDRSVGPHQPDDEPHAQDDGAVLLGSSAPASDADAIELQPGMDGGVPGGMPLASPPTASAAGAGGKKDRFGRPLSRLLDSVPRGKSVGRKP